MTNLKTLVAAAALAIAAVPAITIHASAQSTGGYSTIVATDHSMRASKLIGMEVFNAKGEKLGKIEDIMVKAGAAEPMVVLSVSSDKMVTVPMSHIAVKADKLSMSGTAAQVAAMPAWHYTGLTTAGG